MEVHLLHIKTNKGKAKGKASTKARGDNDDFVPISKSDKAKYTFGGMAEALAATTRIDEVNEDARDNDSNASSELRLSYLDDVLLKQRFPTTKPLVTKPTTTPPSGSSLPPPILKKPLTITLPASNTLQHQPLRSVTDILCELKAPHGSAAVPAAPAIHTARIGGADVAYSTSALASEASAFAAALAQSSLPSQPSPPQPNDSAPAVPAHPSPNPHD